MRQGEEIKGIVVEEYSDRIVLSTYEGEKTIMKDAIRQIVYDLPEQNLVKLGDAFVARHDLEKAYFFYDKALKVNPDYEIASIKRNYVAGYLFRRSRERKLEDVKRMQAAEEWTKSAVAGKAEESADKKLNDEIGITIAMDGGRAKIADVRKGSPAYLAGLRKNDVLVSAWGRLTGYMKKEDIENLLMEHGPGEIRIEIERKFVVNKALTPAALDYVSLIGGKFDMLIDGLTLVDVKEGGPCETAGLKKDDLIMAINGAPTRYMPLARAIKIVKRQDNKKVVFLARRSLTIWHTL
ncbi:MAG: PDZ domain-containing protein [Candidatus Omnitrophica bacterium]|nr:PDZ domain-containing protein [Candidatus Omnitrophota bacterium]